MARKHQPTICARAVKLTLGGALLSSVLAVPSIANASFLSQAYKEATTNDKVTVSMVNYYKSAHRWDTDVKYFDENGKFKQDKYGHHTQAEWTQSLGLFYNSGKIKLGDNPIKMNLNLGYSHVFALDHQYPGGMHNWHGGQKLLESANCVWTGGAPLKGQYKCYDSDGFGKVPMANAKFYWKGGNLTVGDGFFNAGMITTAAADDAALSSYRGVMVKHRWKNFRFDGAFVTGFMDGLGDKMGDLTTNSNYYNPYPDTYDYLYTGRIDYRDGRDWGYVFSYGEAQDYLRRFHTNVWINHMITPETKLHLKAQYYANKAAGDLWQKDVEREVAGFDDHAYLIAYHGKLERDAWGLWYGYHTVDAPRARDGKGGFSYGFGGAKGYLSLASSPGYSSFRSDGGQAHVVGISYDFRHIGLPSLKLAYRYHWERKPVRHHTTYEVAMGRGEEHVIDVFYRPRSGSMKGFEVLFRSSFFRPDRLYAGSGADRSADRGDINAIKAIVSYSFKL
ncbi:OprD family outer membrane porin [Vibrio diabolicus]|uniref:OprD family outer membrane porin n=1 Tax=Vibrio diabolicus TaxID=50719 RepID=A0AA92LP02_9VIBR|nr:OprD family outer membrane porin [Vibrio diabolicus]QRG81448.1 OprD family outer membrane porin [Vibrio diabolicus]